MDSEPGGKPRIPSPLLNDTYLLANLSAGVFHRTHRQEISPCPEHRFSPFSHRLLTSSRVAVLGSETLGNSPSFQSGKFWAVGLALVSLAFTPRVRVAGSGQNAVIQMPFLHSPHQIYLNLELDDSTNRRFRASLFFISIPSSLFLSSALPPAHSLSIYSPNS
jgi:hypothetical protein